MRDFNSIFETMAIILENGEHILRQTARKMEKEFSPLVDAKVKMTGDWEKDYPEFYKLIFGDSQSETTEPEDLKFEKVVRNDFSRSVLITKENIKQVFEWLKTHPGIDTAFPSDILCSSINFTSYEDSVRYTAKVGDYIIEEFDGVDFYIYPKDSEDFERNYHIIKE